MRIAALYDIHANLPALEAVLDDVREAAVDLVVVGGDVLPGPMPCETLDCLQALDRPARYIRGNGDREVLAMVAGHEPASVPAAYRPAMQWVAGQLRREQVQFMEGWSTTLEIEVTGLGAVLFCHATPRNDTDIFTRLTPDDVLLPWFAGVTASVVVCGHTHMPFERPVGGIRVVNAGSVGMPFGPAGADWLLLGRDGIEFRRTDYDLAAAAARIRRSAHPQADDFATNNILAPPAAERMLGLFERSNMTGRE